MAQRSAWRHRSVFGLWTVAIAAGAFAGTIIFDRLESSLDPAPTSEAETVEARLIESTGSAGTIVAIISADPTAPGIDASTRSLIERIGRIEGIAGVGGGTEVHGTAGDSFLISADVEPGLSGDEAEVLITAVRDTLHRSAPGPADLGGSVILDEELGATAESDLLRADAIAVPVVIILTALALGGLRATILPLCIVLAAVTTPLALLLVLSLVTEVSVFAVNVVSMFGVGLAVDYGLLVGSRYREELARHGDHYAAVATTMATAGRAVTYSGVTVAVALSGLLVFRESLLRSLAYGGIGAVLVAVLAARTILPALLQRFPSLLTPSSGFAATGVLYRIARRVQKTPGVVLITVTATLLVLSLPVLNIQFEGLDARSLPSDSESRRFNEILSAEYPAIPVAPIELLADAAHDDPLLHHFADQVSDLATVDRVTATPINSDLTRVAVVAAGPPTGGPALDTVRAIRQIPAQIKVGVTGEAAEEVDLLASMAGRLPAALAMIGTITLLLLIGFTRAPVAAVKALLVNILSVGAAFGILVWIFQGGNVTGLLGFEPIGALEAIILLLTFVFAFGLSMDYEVFLLARIREEYDTTADNPSAVATGLQRSGRVVTQAAFLITVLFIGFAMGDLILIKQLGVGLALAVLVDATIVRILLVPAVMILMGDRNWWAPHWMRRT